jgi:hypothetical protein
MRNVSYGVVAMAILILSGCSIESKIFGSKVSHGIINYAVSFPLMEEGNTIASIMPEKMSMKFQDNKYKTEFSTYGGMFRSNIVVDGNEKEYNQMLKVFRKKLSCSFHEIDINELLVEFPPFEVIPSNKRDTIAGVACKHAHGVYHDIGIEDIDIYYTEEIMLTDPNWCTPFADIDGVLMGYDVDMFDIRMRLRATEVLSESIEDSEFVVDKDYKHVSYKYILTEIEKLMSSFDI